MRIVITDDSEMMLERLQKMLSLVNKVKLTTLLSVNTHPILVKVYANDFGQEYHKIYFNGNGNFSIAGE